MNTAARPNRQESRLRKPSGIDSSIQPERIHNEAVPTAPYNAPIWPLAPLGAPAAVRPGVLTWARFPEQLREAFRYAAWLLINTEAPEITIDKVGSSGVEWPSASTIRTTVMYDWLTFANWSADAGFQQLGDISRQDLELFTRHLLDKGCARNTMTRTLRSITRLWAYAPNLPASDALPMPPWEDEPISDFVKQERRLENTTPIIHPSSMAPLLLWAQRFLDLADDIVAASALWEEQRAQLPPHTTAAGRAAAATLVDSWIRQGRTSLPGKMHIGQSTYDLMYLAISHPGIHPDDFATVLNASTHHFAIDLDSPTLVDSPITATIDAKRWCEGIDYTELPKFMKSIQAAGLVLVTYLTGMRTHEVLALSPGCCTTERCGSTAFRYTINGRKYKRVRRDGRADPDGTERVWTTIQPVAKAISTVERTFPDEKFLFSMLRSKTQALDSVNAAKRIVTLIEMSNKLCERLELPAAYCIPADPAGPISLRRFRRTLAWHIRRLPHGKIALAIQYGHLTVREGEGYASLKSAGFAALMEREEIAALIDNIERTREEIDSGIKISGPAAGRLTSALKHTTRFEGTFLNNAELKRFKRDTDLRVYDNPSQFLTCMFDPSRAACLKGQELSAKPRLDHCSPSCANVVRTDNNVAALCQEASRLRHEADDPATPPPLARRLHDRASGYETIAETHQSMAFTPKKRKPRSAKQ